MPELAEVEYFRKQWDPGLGQKITRVHVHVGKRLFRGTDAQLIAKTLTGSILKESEARSKLMCFRFSKTRARSSSLWLGIHLGMTGRLRVEEPEFSPGKHDHLVLFQKARSLVFQDARMFGRVHFSEGANAPDWWTKLPPPVNSPQFTLAAVREFLGRRSRLAVKAALLIQERFPGVGNWMADEILWQAKIAPQTSCGSLSETASKKLWAQTREVCRRALETVGVDDSDPPKGWLFHERWSRKGKCPRCRTELQTDTVGGRTTRWCSRCQPPDAVR